MDYFPKPTNLNGEELIAELKAAGLDVEQINDNGSGQIYFETDNAELAAKIIEKHNGNIIPREPTIADKLVSVGLSLDELKAAILGGN